jgi:hypothetical protein
MFDNTICSIADDLLYMYKETCVVYTRRFVVYDDFLRIRFLGGSRCCIVFACVEVGSVINSVY